MTTNYMKNAIKELSETLTGKEDLLKYLACEDEEED